MATAEKAQAQIKEGGAPLLAGVPYALKDSTETASHGGVLGRHVFRPEPRAECRPEGARRRPLGDGETVR